MKRRKLLTSAGALAGASLTGCGGGDNSESDLQAASADELRSGLAAFTPPPAELVSENGHYQIEVVFGLQRAVDVQLTSGGRSFSITPLHSKSITTGWSHRVGFAKLRVTNEPKRNFKALGLTVLEQTKNSSGVYSSRGYHAGFEPSPVYSFPADSVRYVAPSEDTGYAHEWNFYTYDPVWVNSKKLFCSVRLFKLPIEEHFAYTDTYLKVIPNNAPIGNLGTLATTRSKHLPTKYDHPSHESAVRKDPKGTHHDTVVLQDRRQPAGFKMLVPTLHHATPELRPMLERLLHRHVAALGKQQAALEPVNGMEDVDQGNLISNELMRLTGGESLIETLNTFRTNMEANVATLFGSIGAEAAEFARNNLPGLMTSEISTQANRILSDAAAAVKPTEQNAAAGFAIMDTVSVQLSGGGSMKNYPFPGFNLGGAFRASFPLLQASFTWGRVSALGSNQNDYYIPTPYSPGVSGKIRFQIVLIVKLIDAGSLLSIDFEFSANLLLVEGNVVVESMVFDPVIDIDARGICGRLAESATKAAMNKVLGTAVSQLFNYTFDSTGVESAVAARTAESALALANLPGGAFAREYFYPVMEALDASAGVKKDEVFKVVELSFLRFKLGHRDLGKDDAPMGASTPRWAYGSFGWSPAIKSINGIGCRLSYKSPKVAVFGTPQIVASGFFRLVNTFDIGLIHGNENYMKAQSLILN